MKDCNIKKLKMLKKRSIEIYNCLKQSSKNHLDGLDILNEVKSICKCSTKDILTATKMNSQEKIMGCISHTTIFDFGITSEDIQISFENEGDNNSIAPTDLKLRGNTAHEN